MRFFQGLLNFFDFFIVIILIDLAYFVGDEFFGYAELVFLTRFIEIFLCFVFFISLLRHLQLPEVLVEGHALFEGAAILRFLLLHSARCFNKIMRIIFVIH